MFRSCTVLDKPSSFSLRSCKKLTKLCSFRFDLSKFWDKLVSFASIKKMPYYRSFVSLRFDIVAIAMCDPALKINQLVTEHGRLKFILGSYLIPDFHPITRPKIPALEGRKNTAGGKSS